MPKVDKVIVTNSAALKTKYGAGAATINAAISRLIVADAKRGLTTKLIALDSVVMMRKLGVKPVADLNSAQQNKQAIDGVFDAMTPDYLVLLGAVDVIPHQDLTNPVKDDDDKIAWGDLPYACSAPYSKKVGDFLGPTRVLGRIPDVTGRRDPKYLAAVLDVAATYASSPRATYAPYLGMTAAVWAKSTALSLENTFGQSTDLQQVPPKSSRWPASTLSRRSHFINCHGGPGDPHFYGQHGTSYPVAHDAAYLGGRITAGTVASAECCYGAELYDPAVAGGHVGICNTYLENSAYGFFGSSTTAYGPSSGNGSADLICQYFMQQMLAGASLGRAALEARQQFVQAASTLDPSDLKTLAQFSLMGDPSVHPVEMDLPALNATKAYAKALPRAHAQARRLRRARLIKLGLVLGRTAGAARYAPKLKPSAKVRATLDEAAKEVGLDHLSVSSYAVFEPVVHVVGKSMAMRNEPSAFHVAVGRYPEHAQPVQRIVLFIVTEVNGEIVRLRRLDAR